MRVVQGLLLGLAAGFAVAAGLGVEQEVTGLLVGLALLLSLVLWLVSVFRSPAPRTLPTGTQPAGTLPRPSVRPTLPGDEPGGMFLGRTLGDALDWVAGVHGLRVLYSVTVTEGGVDVLAGSVLGGPVTFLAVTAGPGGFQGAVDALPSDVAEGTGRVMVDDAFTAADLAPDVLSRLFDDARRQDARPRLDGADVAALIDRPRGLRPEVTVRLAVDDEWSSATWWGSADGRLLHVDVRAEA